VLSDFRPGDHVVGGLDRDGVGADRRLELIGCVDGHDLALVNDRDAIAALGFVHVVGGEEHGGRLAGAQRVDVLPDVDTRLGVEPNRRLVEEEDSRHVEETAGDLEPSLHPARVEPSLLVGPVGKADHFEQLGHAGVDVRARQPIHHAVEAEVLRSRQVVVERELLENEPDVRPYRVRCPRHVVARDSGDPTRRMQQRAQHRDGRRLTGPIGAEESEQLAGLDTERNAVNRGEVAEPFDQIVDFDGDPVALNHRQLSLPADLLASSSARYLFIGGEWALVGIVSTDMELGGTRAPRS
jgi:hypothetical protein